MVPRDDGIAPVQGVSADRRALTISATADAAKQSESERAPEDTGGVTRSVVAGDSPKFLLQNQDARITFEKDEASGQMVMRLKDSSGRVIRQVPPEDMLRLARAIDQYLGLLVDRHS